MKLSAIWNVWNHFWFEPRSPLPMAVFRIFYGLQVLIFVLLLIPDFSTWYGSHSMVSAASNKEWLQTERFSVLSWLPAAPGTIYGAFAVLAIVAITTALGFCTRTSLAVLVLLLISIHHKNLLILNSGDLFMRLTGVYLLFSHSGDALSLDNLLKKRRGIVVEPMQAIWAQRLLQLQLCTVYLHSCMGKIGGESWLNGTALYYVGRLKDFERISLPYLFDNEWTIKLMTWGTLAIEFALWTLIWLRDVRYYVLAAGVLLHLGIELTMNIPLFETQMITAYIVFVDAADIQRCIDKLKSTFSFRKIASAS